MCSVKLYWWLDGQLLKSVFQYALSMLNFTAVSALAKVLMVVKPYSRELFPVQTMTSSGYLENKHRLCFH